MKVKMGKLGIILIFTLILHAAMAHHDSDPWHTHFHEHGIFRAFFGGFFSTLLLIFGVLVFYYYCVRTGALGKTFPLFPRKPIIPITIPFARAPNFIDGDRPETIVLTNASASAAPSVFYSNKAHSLDPWRDPSTISFKTPFSGYNAL